jgi:hypothetical protein
MAFRPNAPHQRTALPFSKWRSGTFRKHFRFSSHEHFIGQGMVHDT